MFCRISFGQDIVCRYGRRIVDDLFSENAGTDYADHAQKNYTDHQGFEKPYANAFFLHSFLRRNILFPSGKIIISVIHE